MFLFFLFVIHEHRNWTDVMGMKMIFSYQMLSEWDSRMFVCFFLICLYVLNGNPPSNGLCLAPCNMLLYNVASLSLRASEEDEIYDSQTIISGRNPWDAAARFSTYSVVYCRLSVCLRVERELGVGPWYALSLLGDVLFSKCRKCYISLPQYGRT